MVGKSYLLRQAVTLLKLAQLTKDRAVAASLADKAADLQSRAHETASAPDYPNGSRDLQPGRS
jgi:hypothetical protein